MNRGFDPWHLLGVAPEADAEEVRLAWRQLAAEHHPDRFVGGSDAERVAAADRMTVINAAYEEIRSGRAVPPVGVGSRRATTSSPPSGGPPPEGPPPEGPPPGGPSPMDETADPRDVDEILDTARRILRQRDRRLRLRRTLRVVSVLLVAVVFAAGLHVYLSQDYGYARVWDGQGNTYADVDCGNRYDRGGPTARELRARSVGSFGGGDLRHQADVVEEVCGQWTQDLWLLWLGVVPVGAYTLWWLLGRRTRRTGW